MIQCVTEEQLQRVNDWLKLIITDESRSSIGQGDDVGIFVLSGVVSMKKTNMAA